MRASKLNTHYMIDIIFKTAKLSYLETMQIKKIYKKPNFQSHLHIFQLNFDKANHCFLQPFFCWRKKIFKKFSAWGFEWGISAFSQNGNTINLIFFPHGEIYKSEKIQQVFWRDVALRSLKKYERCILEANLEEQGW